MCEAVEAEEIKRNLSVDKADIANSDIAKLPSSVTATPNGAGDLSKNAMSMDGEEAPQSSTTLESSHGEGNIEHTTACQSKVEPVIAPTLQLLPHVSFQFSSGFLVGTTGKKR